MGEDEHGSVKRIPAKQLYGYTIEQRFFDEENNKSLGWEGLGRVYAANAIDQAIKNKEKDCWCSLKLGNKTYKREFRKKPLYYFREP